MVIHRIYNRHLSVFGGIFKFLIGDCCKSGFGAICALSLEMEQQTYSSSDLVTIFLFFYFFIIYFYLIFLFLSTEMGTPFFICQIAATKLYPCSPREEYFSYFTVACYRSSFRKQFRDVTYRSVNSCRKSSSVHFEICILKNVKLYRCNRIRMRIVDFSSPTWILVTVFILSAH